MERYYYSFNEYLQGTFKTRVQRVSVNAGFGCPNRDGTLSADGCIFCNEEGFTNFPTLALSLSEQIITSIAFFKKRFKAKKFIAYFQNASSTYASVDDLKKAFDTIQQFSDIVGLSISTRPDCIDDEKLNLIAGYKDAYDVWIEYGLQSVNDTTLETINRSHTFSQFVTAVEATVKKDIKVSAHVILGLPGEEKEDIITTAKTLSRLPLSGVKIHVLHVLQNTKLARLYETGSIRLFEADEYVGFVCDFLEHLSSDFVIMRLVSNAKPDVLIAPQWVNQKQKILDAINDEFKRRKTKQGIYYQNKSMHLCKAQSIQ